MAKSDFGTIIGLGIAGVGAYWLWSSGTLSNLFGSTTAVAAPAGGVIPASTPPPTTSSIVPAPVSQTPVAPSTPPPAPPTNLTQIAQGADAAQLAVLNAQYQALQGQIAALGGTPAGLALQAQAQNLLYQIQAIQGRTQGSGSLASQIVAIAGAGPMGMDNWNVAYNQILANRQPGQPPVSGATFNQMLASAGLTDATRGTPLTIDQFVAALSANGLSGLNRTHMRRVHYVSPARYAGGNYKTSMNTSPQGRF